MVPLYFINQYYKSYKLVRISPSGLPPLDHYKFGKLIQSIIKEDEKVVWVASGDLSHSLKKGSRLGYAKEGPIFDKELTEALATGDFLKLLSFEPHFIEKAAECGLNSFNLMAGAIDGYQVKANLLSYEGTFGVGYAVAKFEVLGQDNSRMFDRIYESKEEKNINSLRKNEDPYVSLARESLEYYVKNNKKMTRPRRLIKDLVNNKAGVFVSIHKNNQLRGCIGTIGPTTKCIADEIIENSVSAGTRDPRFDSIHENELPYLQYKVDVLFPSEPIESMSQLDIEKYGVIVSHNHKQGLLLPNIDGIDSIKEQVDIAKRKAGISDKESFKMERFEVIRHY